MTGKQKLYFFLNRIDDARVLTPSGQPLKLHAVHDFKKKLRDDELEQIFTKLEKDEKVLSIYQIGNLRKAAESKYGLGEAHDGFWYIELLPTFDEYFQKIQGEPEYQRFTGKPSNTVQNNASPAVGSPEETFNRQVWEILQQIKEEILVTRTDEPVMFRHTQTVGKNLIPRQRRENIIKKLEEWGVLRIRENPFEYPYSTEDYLYLDIYSDTFQTVYDKYQKACDLQTYLNEYQRQVYEGSEAPSQFQTLDSPITPATLLVDRITSIYERTKTAKNPSVFFKNLYEYTNEYFREDLLVSIVGAINELGNSETAKLKRLEEQAYQEIDTTFQELLVYCEKLKVESAMVAEAIKDYRGHKEGRIESSDGQLSGCMSEVEDILRGLSYTKEPAHVEVIKRYAVFTDDKEHLKRFTFAPSYDDYMLEKKKLDRLKETTVWFSWDKLYTFYRLYTDHEAVYKSFAGKGKLLTALSSGMLADELSAILTRPNDPTRYIREFEVDTYKDYLDRVHQFAKELLYKFEEYKKAEESKPKPQKLETPAKKQSADTQTTNTWYFDSATNILTVADETIKLQNNSNRSELFKILSKSKKNATQVWESVEMYELLYGTESTEYQKMKYKIYYLCRDLNAHIANKISKQNFFIYSMTSMRVNPVFSFAKK